MATITYYTTPAKLEEGFRDTGTSSYSLSSTKVTLSYGNLKLIVTGTGFSNSLSGTIKGLTVELGGKKQLVATNISISLKNAYYADDSYDYVMDRAVGGADTITGSAYSDKLYGWGGNDTIKGLAGNDRIIGGMGRDKLYGGSGKDVFDLNKASESGTSSSSRDVIADFMRGSDKIDLATIDANPKVSGNNAFTKLFNSNTAFTAPGQLKFTGGILYGNTDSDSAAEFSIQLTGISKLALSDFIL